MINSEKENLDKVHLFAKCDKIFFLFFKFSLLSKISLRKKLNLNEFHLLQRRENQSSMESFKRDTCKSKHKHNLGYRSDIPLSVHFKYPLQPINESHPHQAQKGEKIPDFTPPLDQNVLIFEISTNLSSICRISELSQTGFNFNAFC